MLRAMDLQLPELSDTNTNFKITVKPTDRMACGAGPIHTALVSTGLGEQWDVHAFQCIMCQALFRPVIGNPSRSPLRARSPAARMCPCKQYITMEGGKKDSLSEHTSRCQRVVYTHVVIVYPNDSQWIELPGSLKQRTDLLNVKLARKCDFSPLGAVV